VKLEGERFLAQERVPKCIRVVSRVKEAWGGAVIAPPREFARWGVRDPDMSRSGFGHV
jgi:hypothetical protein